MQQVLTTLNHILEQFFNGSFTHETLSEFALEEMDHKALSQLEFVCHLHTPSSSVVQLP